MGDALDRLEVALALRVVKPYTRVVNGKVQQVDGYEYETKPRSVGPPIRGTARLKGKPQPAFPKGVRIVGPSADEMMRRLMSQDSQDELARRMIEIGISSPPGPDQNDPQWHDFARSADSSAPGNCYQVALEMILDAQLLGLKNPKVIHATVLGNGGDVNGVRYGHGWVEADFEGYGGTYRVALDWSSFHRSVVLADAYRRMGNAKDIHEYTRDEAMRWAMREEVYGPWEGNILVNDGEGGLKQAKTK